MGGKEEEVTREVVAHCQESLVTVEGTVEDVQVRPH